MLNIGKLLRGKERYYLDQVARSQEEYYTGAGEAPGQWAGAAAAELDVAGEVSEDGLLRMLAGAHPDTAARLGGPPHGERVLAYDLTFRAPKSVSLLYALGAPAVSRAAQEGHRRALAAALGYLERHAAVARRGHGFGVGFPDGRAHMGPAERIQQADALGCPEGQVEGKDPFTMW